MQRPGRSGFGDPPPVRGRATLGLAIALTTLFVCGCQRGCLKSWLEERGPGTTRGGGGGPDLGGTDCSDGLARCVGGVIAVSRSFHIPHPCPWSPERCSCPWEPLGTCPNGCAAEGLERVLAPEKAIARLCAPPPGEMLARPSDALPPPGICRGERYRCEGSLVIRCDPQPAVVAACLRGCADAELDDEEPVEPSSAVALLCARGDLPARDTSPDP